MTDPKATRAAGRESELLVWADGTAVSLDELQAAVGTIAADFAALRDVRQHRTELVAEDFDRLRLAGFPRVAAPADRGGLWVSAEASTRPVSEMLRGLAKGDPSVALVAAMHPAVMWESGWLSPAVPPPRFRQAWERQRQEVFERVVSDGAFCATIWSEPGPDRDLSEPRAVARESGEGYRLSGLKHLGSGLGIASFMVTLAVPAGETEPDAFLLDLRDVPLDGSAGIEVVGPWDGHGMVASQSHTVRFEDFPAVRTAWPHNRRAVLGLRASPVRCFWAAIVLGIVEIAVETARARLEPIRSRLAAFDQVEWSRVELEAWLVRQAYEGMLRAVEGDAPAELPTLWGKTAIAELSEAALTRLCRVVGGSTYSRRSPFGWWQQDVRVLGFLRPRWGLAYEAMFGQGMEASS
jgi:alkylation response protein AidB-like acyl-CoA dehydrogenase